MDAAAIAEFAALSAENRHAVFAPLTAPGGITYGGQNYPAVVSPLAESRADLERGSWPLEVSVTIRVRRAAGIAPAQGALLTVVHTGRVLRIVSLRDHVPEEWILGCADPEN